MGVTLRNVTDAIEAVLADKVGDIPWQTSVMGAVFPKKLTGFIICDEIDYQPFEKEDQVAEATYGIQVICPNPKGSPALVEDYAMAVRKALAEEAKLDGWALDSRVLSITFGTPAGLPDIGVAIIKYLVRFEE